MTPMYRFMLRRVPLFAALFGAFLLGSVIGFVIGAELELRAMLGL